MINYNKDLLLKSNERKGVSELVILSPKWSKIARKKKNDFWFVAKHPAGWPVACPMTKLEKNHA